jgi:uncharacterized lipoprotein YehR (DUF1307 family)
MKRLFLLALVAIVTLTGCSTSEGRKFGLLQKVSHKTLPCNYYVAEFAFEGGRKVGSGDDASYQNTQEVEITSAQYDSLQNIVGDRVVFEYNDQGVTFCGNRKKLTYIQVKR